MERYEIQKLIDERIKTGYVFTAADRDLHKEIKTKMAPECIVSGVAAWDDLLGGFRKGVCNLIAAATGTGKTRLLLALAKKAKAHGYKVLYVGNNEEPIDFIMDHTIEHDIPLMIKTEKTWEQIDLYMLDHDLDIVFYDYLGAGVDYSKSNASYTLLMNETRALQENAQQHNYALVTAVQAKDELNMVDPKTGKLPQPQYQNSYIEMAHYVSNYVKAAVYLQRVEESGKYISYLWPLKNSYGQRKTGKKVLQLDYAKAEIEEPLAFDNRRK